MKTLFFGFLIALGPMLGVTQDTKATNGKRIATLSVQRVINESAAGRAANQQLQALAQKMSSDVSAKQKELQAAAPPAGADNRPAELQRFIQQSQAEYANTQRQLQTDLREKLNPIVASVAAARGLELVLNADTAVVWAAPTLDVTSDVLAKLAAPPAK